MKKILEANMFRFTLVLTLVAIVCGLMIGGMNAITDPIIKENIFKARVAAYEKVLPALESFDDVELVDADPTSVASKVIAKDTQDKIVGYIYEVFKTNKFGQMRIVVSVSPTGQIIGAEFVEIVQTYQVEQTKLNLQAYVGASLSEIEPTGDIISGATGSLTTLTSLLEDVAVAHANTAVAPDDPMIEWFGSGYTKAADPAFTATDTILVKEIVKDANGNVIASYFHLRGTSEYNPGSVGSINIYIGVATDGKILGINMPREEYGHSKGEYYPLVNSYVQSLVGDNIQDYSGDISAGASHNNSRTLINSMLETLGGLLS